MPPNHRRQRTPRVRPVCISCHWRGAAAAERYPCMPRLFPILVVLIIGSAGCGRKADPVIAAFGNDEFTTNRIVFYATGRYEHYGSAKNGTLSRHPVLTGSFVAGGSNYVVTFNRANPPKPNDPLARKVYWIIKNRLKPNDPPTRKAYRIIQHDGVEYLFDESSLAIKKYEESKNPRELRHAWRREEG